MSVGHVDKPVVAAFDFDGTLTYRDSLLPFLLYVSGVPMFVRHMFASLPTLAGYALGMIANDVAKQRMLTRFFAGVPIAQLRIKAEQFSALKLPALIRPAALCRLAWHKQQGHRCIVISASLDIYVRPWALRAGFDEVIASRLETLSDGRVSGKLLEGNCFGSEKIRRLEALLGGRSGYTLYAYGDSRGDRELLASADFSFYRHLPD